MPLNPTFPARFPPIRQLNGYFLVEFVALIQNTCLMLFWQKKSPKTLFWVKFPKSGKTQPQKKKIIFFNQAK
jgi:hypothetical protein